MQPFRTVEAFIHVAELGSFTDAAERLHVTQATVSRWIQALEEETELKLLDRTTRAVRVTEAGARFYDRVRALPSLWLEAVSDAKEVEQFAVGRLRVSLPSVLGERFIAPHIPRFLEAHDRVELELSLNDRYVDLVRDGFDLAVRVGVPVDVDYKRRVLSTSRRRLVASPCYLRERGGPKTPEELRDHPCITHTGLEGRVSWTFERNGNKTSVPATGPYRTDNSLAALHAARAGAGIALLADFLVDEDLREKALVPLLCDYEPPEAPVHALLVPGPHQSGAARAFLEFLEDLFSSESADA